MNKYSFNMLKGPTVIQKDPESLEKGAERNFVVY